MLIFSWHATASGSGAAITAGLSAYANGHTYAAGDVILGGGGEAFGCTVGGLSAASGSGPSGSDAGQKDGAAYFTPLSRCKRVVLTNLHASALLYSSTFSSVSSSTGGGIGPNGGARNYSAEAAGYVDPTDIYVAGSGGLSVEASVDAVVEASGGAPGSVTVTAASLATEATLLTVSSTLTGILAKLIVSPATEATLAAAKADLDTLNSTVALASKQDTGNTTLATISASISALVAANHTDLTALHTDLTTTHADLAAILAKQPATPALEGGNLASILAALGALPAARGATTPAGSTSVTGSLSTSTFTTVADATASGSPATLGGLAAGPSGIIVQNTSADGVGNLRVGEHGSVSTTRGRQIRPGVAEFFAVSNANLLDVIAESGSPTYAVMQG